jgi:hypothetical protein
MPGKRVQFDDETLNAIRLLARDRMQDFQELADEAVSDLLRKYGRSSDLKAALSQSAESAGNSAVIKPDFPLETADPLRKHGRPSDLKAALGQSAGNSAVISFPLETAAARLGVTRRRLMEWLRSHPCDASGRAFYGSMGRAKLFTDDDLHRINAAIREDRPCSSSTRRGRASRRTGASGARTSDAVWTSLAELTGDKSLLGFSRKSKEYPGHQRPSENVAAALTLIAELETAKKLKAAKADASQEPSP